MAKSSAWHVAKNSRRAVEAHRNSDPASEALPKGGRPRIGDQQALKGIIYVLQTGIPWEDLPLELGYRSSMTCWRRLRDWQAAGVWHRLHHVLLAELRRAGMLDLSRASLDAAIAPPPPGRGAYT